MIKDEYKFYTFLTGKLIITMIIYVFLCNIHVNGFFSGAIQSKFLCSEADLESVYQNWFRRPGDRVKYQNLKAQRTHQIAS